ncbi:RNA polymerase factor sigma-54 [Paenibacillus rigui]|uniref:RNA polymerase sigma-54 factor n=1 Tax=Paenibacillus rigui TaxID=554312 RepID=A0A229UKT6_9BACL|nr:RNA polymerase factor sigma-54 [Paenibacillus rigui]OXM83915.1 RNA polymerase sigma-54 factor [Paenibacillus rigui]
MYLNQTLTQTQSLKLNMKLVQGLKLLQMSATELTEYLEKQSDENPLMEVIFPSRSPQMERRTAAKTPLKDSASNPNDLLLHMASKHDESLERVLVSQLRLNPIPKPYFALAEFIAGSLNDDGYLTLSLEEIAEHVQRPICDIEEALAYVQALEPAGVAARSLRECLLLQAGRDVNADPWAALIVSEHLQEIAAGKLQAVAGQLGISIEQVKSAIQYIRKLNPRPGLAFSTQTEARMEPDAFVQKVGGRFVVTLNEVCYPQVSMNEYYLKLRKQSACKRTKAFVGQYMTPIQWLIRNLEQRKATISRVLTAIIEEQEPFLEKGPLYLRPLNLKTVAEKVSLDVSTISRAVKHKYVQTPQGVYPLKFFFSSRLETRNEECASSHSIKAIIMQMVREEDKSRPLSDQQMTDALVRQGLKISRRTVMKYREALHILSSRFRSS